MPPKKQEVRDNAFEHLKSIARTIVHQIEKDCGTKLSRNPEKDLFLSRIAGITYGTLIEEVKTAFKTHSQDILKIF